MEQQTIELLISVLVIFNWIALGIRNVKYSKKTESILFYEYGYHSVFPDSYVDYTFYIFVSPIAYFIVNSSRKGIIETAKDNLEVERRKKLLRKDIESWRR